MRRRHLSLLAAATAGVLAAGVLTSVVAQVAATGCRVDYAISSQWQGGFGATVTITNLGDPIDGRSLTWPSAPGRP